MEFDVGSVLEGQASSYEIIEQLAEGGFGVTYLARDRQDDEQVVVKTLRIERLADWKSLELFEREGKVLKSLHHDRIPRYRDWFALGSEDTPRGFVLVQTFVPGVTLRAVRRGERRLDHEQMVAWFLRMLEVCAYLHERNPPVLHRDITPKNIIIADEGGDPVLIDFGSVQARLRSEESAASTTAGTFGYAPLEQFVGNATPASDLYGLAMTFLAVASGLSPEEMPFDGNRVNVAKTLQGYNRRLLDALLRMTEPNPDQRSQSARALLDELRPHRAELARETSEPAPKPKKPKKKEKDKKAQAKPREEKRRQGEWKEIKEKDGDDDERTFRWAPLIMALAVGLPLAILIFVQAGNRKSTAEKDRERETQQKRVRDRNCETASSGGILAVMPIAGKPGEVFVFEQGGESKYCYRLRRIDAQGKTVKVGTIDAKPYAAPPWTIGTVDDVIWFWPTFHDLQAWDMLTISRLTSESALVLNNPALKAGLNEKDNRKDVKIAAERRALQVSTLDGMYHLVDARSGKVLESKAERFVPERPLYPPMDDCAPTLADGTKVSFEGGTYRKTLRFVDGAGKTLASSETFLMPRVVSKDVTRCPALQLGEAATILVVHRTAVKEGRARLSAVAAGDGKTLWSRELPGSPDGMMGYWLTATQFCRRGSSSEDNEICAQTTEGVRLFDGVLYVPFWRPPALLAVDPATGKLLWTYR